MTGTIALLAGASGTGKTLAARAIAQTLQTPLVCIDLSQVLWEAVPQLLQDMTAQAPTVLLLKAAQTWFSRTALLSPAVLHQFLSLRRQHGGLTLLSVHHTQSITAQWRRQITPLLNFPLPDQEARIKLWQQAFPPPVPLDVEIDWLWLAQHGVLSGGEINAIARDAAIAAAATNSNVTMQHLTQAYDRVTGRRRRGMRNEE